MVMGGDGEGGTVAVERTEPTRLVGDGEEEAGKGGGR